MRCSIEARGRRNTTEPWDVRKIQIYRLRVHYQGVIPLLSGSQLSFFVILLHRPLSNSAPISHQFWTLTLALIDSLSVDRSWSCQRSHCLIKGQQHCDNAAATGRRERGVKLQANPWLRFSWGCKIQCEMLHKGQLFVAGEGSERLMKLGTVSHLFIDFPLRCCVCRFCDKHSDCNVVFLTCDICSIPPSKDASLVDELPTILLYRPSASIQPQLYSNNPQPLSWYLHPKMTSCLYP